MPLPIDSSTPWPPAELAPITRDLTEADAWYSGDPDKLASLYARTDQRTRRRTFWSRQTNRPSVPSDRVHMPIAADIASVSADLLFGDDLAITVDEAHGETPDAGAQAVEERLSHLIDTAQVQTTLLEAAEVCSALGGVYLRVVWDPSIANHPIVDAVHADRAVPEWRWGRLSAVTFWRQVATDGQTVWRHLERHEPGWIMHGLYAGDRDRLGVRMPLDRQSATRGLDDEINVATVLRGPAPTAFYVPNARPNRRHRGRPEGRPDTQGLIPAMDALDEAASALAREVRLGKSRIIVPDEFLDRAGPGRGATFDPDREIFSPLEMDPASAANAGITHVQPAIRAAEHGEIITRWLRTCVSSAGYSPATFGLGDANASAATATEVRAREADTLRTTNRKRRYWDPVLPALFEALLVVDRAVFRGPVDPLRPTVEFAPVASEDPHRLAETLTALRNAQAASIETRVRMAQPNLEGEALAAEVERIKSEESITVDDPTGGFM